MVNLLNQIITPLVLCVSILLLLQINASGQQSYSLSDEALAAAKRFSADPRGRTLADIEIVLRELQKVGDTTSTPTKEYQAISRQQLIDLLGPATYESNGALIYGHRWGSSLGHTSFFLRRR